MQGTTPGHIPWWFPPIPLCHLSCPHLQMRRSSEPVIAFCHPVSTRAQLPPGSDVQGHRLKPYPRLPRPSNQLSQGLGGGVLLGFLPWLLTRGLDLTYYKPRFDSVVPLSQRPFRAQLTGQHLGWNRRLCCENKTGVGFLHHPGSFTVACSVQMWGRELTLWQE